MHRPLPTIDPDDDQQFLKLIESLKSKTTEVMNESSFVERVDIGRVNRMRFSSLPFCGLKWFINLPKSLVEDRERFVNFGYKFYTSVGHVVHDVIQTAFHNYPGVSTVSDYVCTSCKKRYSLKKSPVKKCSCGSLLLKREEHEITWMGAVGHIDEIVYLGTRGSTTQVFLLDYKTTSLNSVYKTDPPGYLSQLSSYAGGLMDENPKIKVVGYGLMYVPRDNPFKFRLSPYIFDEKSRKSSVRRFQGWTAAFEIASSVKTERQALALIAARPCRDKGSFIYSDCEHYGQCAGCGPQSEHMEFLVKTTFKKIKAFLPVKDLK